MFSFLMVQIFQYFRHKNGDGKLKFNEFTASIENWDKSGAGLSYDFCVLGFFKKVYFKFFKLRGFFSCWSDFGKLIRFND